MTYLLQANTQHLVKKFERAFLTHVSREKVEKYHFVYEVFLLVKVF